MTTTHKPLEPSTVNTNALAFYASIRYGSVACDCVKAALASPLYDTRPRTWARIAAHWAILYFESPLLLPAVREV
jgi:hypothetical protein